VSSTPTVTPTATNMSAATFAPTPTPSATSTATATPTATSPSSPTDTSTPTPTNTPTPTATQGGPLDLIFADGFESGSFSAWSSTEPGNGGLSVSTSAALVGTYGMQVSISDTSARYVVDQSPDREARYRARFFFDPNSLTMSHGQTHFIFFALDENQSPNPVVVQLRLRYFSGNYQLRVETYTDSGARLNGSYTNISDAPHYIEFDWASGSPGGLTMWIDGVETETITNITNTNLRIDTIQLGPQNLQSGTSGSYYFDSFESRRESYIGTAMYQPTTTSPVAWLGLWNPFTNQKLEGKASTGMNSIMPSPNMNIFTAPLEQFEEIAFYYSYDDLYRLTERASNFTSTTYRMDYDAVGNRQNRYFGLLDEHPIQYTYDLANRVETVDNVPYTFDNNGNLISDDVVHPKSWTKLTDFKCAPQEKTGKRFAG
jgi:hypothetical protein